MATTTCDICVNFIVDPRLSNPTVSVRVDVGGKHSISPICECATYEFAEAMANNLNEAFKRVTVEEWARKFEEIHNGTQQNI